MKRSEIKFDLGCYDTSCHNKCKGATPHWGAYIFNLYEQSRRQDFVFGGFLKGMNNISELKSED